jgi:hypothetical protein
MSTVGSMLAVSIATAMLAVYRSQQSPKPKLYERRNAHSVRLFGSLGTGHNYDGAISLVRGPRRRAADFTSLCITT